jgi:ubiquinone/menaquinone biosynthesis C-methylase UbiE
VSGGHRFEFEKAHKLDDPDRQRWQPAAAVIPELQLQPESVVLDLGAGTGYFALPIAQHLAGLGGSGRVMAVDIEPRMLELLAARAAEAGLASRVERIAIDAARSEQLPLEDASVDRALLANIYHELPDASQTLEELRRVLRPGALLLIVDWAPGATLDKGPPREHRVSPSDVSGAMRQAGFTEVAALSIYDAHFALRALQPPLG